MKQFLTITIVFILSIHTSFAQGVLKEPVQIIFDTDMGGDYDDVGAITELHALADSGYANILATVASVKYEGVAGVINVLNTYFKRPDMLIGVPKGNALTTKDWQHWTDTLLARYPHSIKNNNDVPDAVTIYRKVLASQPDTSVTIVTVGFLTNLANLLASGPDEYSPLPGKELIKQKVKLLVSMAGKFPSGREYNVFSDSAASKIVYENWSAPVLFDGFEIGEKIKSGLPLIKSESIKNSPVKDVFSLCIPKSKDDADGRMSWDEIAVLVAIKGYQPWFTLQNGKIVVDESGSNSWDNNGSGQFYLVFSQ
ncbi:MAG: nucleoside hydrolase, partial [Ignavibacteriaceae bacterium]|nr:nucleoside hydrolase [Ignavibacteriaceae bacterium]